MSFLLTQAAKRDKGEPKSSNVGMLAHVPMPEPRSKQRRRQKQRPIGALTGAEQAVKAAETKRATEHELSVNVPRRATTKPQIQRLFEDGKLNERQFRAAERLQKDFVTSGFEPPLIASYEGVGVGGAGMIGTGPTAREYMVAMDAVGPGLSGVLVAVVFMDASPANWAASKGKDRHHGLPLLQAALDNLAGHYDRQRERY